MAKAEAGKNGPFNPDDLEGPPVRTKREVPDGLWMRCSGCEGTLFRRSVVENMDVCPECGHHFRIGAARRIELLTDPDSFEELFADVAPADPLCFKWDGKNYPDYIRSYQDKAGTTEGILTGIAYIKGRRVALGVMNSEFIMGSMGSVIGEKVSLLAERARDQQLPLVAVCASGGARMQEGALSVMQMGKTAAALARFDDAGGLYISVLTDPTMAGVSASFATLGDIMLAEPGAMIGFAGPRVIANTIKEELPEGFQKAEFLLAHGFIDRIVARKDLRNEIAQFIDYLGG